jgi:hypothetical protein
MRGSRGFPTRQWLTDRLLVHLIRFAVLQVGLLVVGELLFASLSCLQYLEHIRTMGDIADCSTLALFFLLWLGLPYLEIHLVPVVILACVGTVFWAWLDRKRFRR